jgi:plastocyanin
MSSFRNCLIALAILCSAPFGVYSATHEVTVGNNFFSPNDLTIQVGDTVRWTNNAGFHDVTADDFSWASPTSGSFIYERTFNTVEEVLYHCSVHSTAGQPIGSSMNGRLNVIEAEPAFLINPAISDAWFNPLTGGQGFFIIVWQDIQTIFLSWFTYDTERPPEDIEAFLGEPGHRWLTAQGPYDGDTAVLDVFMTAGGVVDSVEPPVNAPVNAGTITIVWTGCNEGLLSYDLTTPVRSGDIPIERIVLDNVAACQAEQTLR